MPIDDPTEVMHLAMTIKNKDYTVLNHYEELLLIH